MDPKSSQIQTKHLWVLIWLFCSDVFQKPPVGAAEQDVLFSSETPSGKKQNYFQPFAAALKLSRE